MLRLQKQLNDATGATAVAEAAPQRRAGSTSTLLVEANALNAKYATVQERLAQEQLRSNASKATGIVTEEAYTAAMAGATAAAAAETSDLAKLGFTMAD